MVATRKNGGWDYLRAATDEDIDAMYAGRGISYDRETDPTIDAWTRLAARGG
jgi:hypothetical protein